MYRAKLVTDEIYHIYNRGVEKREIFLDDDDRLRFIHDLFEFNDKNPAINLNNYFNQKQPQSLEVGLPKIGRKPRKLLVELLAFCLMPNHFHLIVRQKTENGITEFMRKLGTGYTNFFNQKYQRVGSLFQGKYKMIHLEKEEYFIYLSFYIHLNPLGIEFSEWQNKKINNYKEAVKFLENYKWSSFLDYIEIKNFPSVTQRDFLMEIFRNSTQYKSDIFEWLKQTEVKTNNLGKIKGIMLE